MKIKWTAETKTGRILSAGVTPTIQGWEELQKLKDQGYDMKERLSVTIIRSK